MTASGFRVYSGDEIEHSGNEDEEKVTTIPRTRGQDSGGTTIAAMPYSGVERKGGKLSIEAKRDNNSGVQVPKREESPRETERRQCRVYQEEVSFRNKRRVWVSRTDAQKKEEDNERAGAHVCRRTERLKGKERR